MKYVVFIIILIVGLSTFVFAQDNPTIELPGINLEGDIIYSPKNKSFGIGKGYDILAFKNNLLNLRVEFIITSKNSISSNNAMIGIGINLNTTELIKRLFDIETNTIPNIGVMQTINLNTKIKTQTTFYITSIILKY